MAKVTTHFFASTSSASVYDSEWDPGPAGREVPTPSKYMCETCKADIRRGELK